MKLSFFLFLFFPLTILAQETIQEVIGSAGGQFKNENLSVSATLGEVVTETFTTNNYTLSQGFHQGNLTINQVSEDLPLVFGIKVYPNPVQEILMIETEATDFSYQVLDANGRVLIHGAFTRQPMHIDFSAYPEGIYFLQVENHKTHKIIKH